MLNDEHPLGDEFFKPKPQLVDKIVDDWPSPMRAEAFTGLAGDFVRLIEPHTEADSHALLGMFMIYAGVLLGREAWCVAEARRHYPVEFVLLVGKSSASRKGSALARVDAVMDRVDEDFSERKLSGLSSGEGLVKGLSPKDSESGPRSFLGILSEFATLLGVMRREGNTMSSILREVWDCSRLRVLTKHDPLDVDGVNLSIIGHITPDELLNGLTSIDRMNGFANRFLLLCVRRSKFLPEGGGDVNMNNIVGRLNSAVKAAKGRGCMQRDSIAKDYWAQEYPRLVGDREGLLGAICSRAEAHVLRLSLLYALLDQADVIRLEHLRAALAFWDYCERSAKHIFGAATGDVDADKIVGALASGPLSIRELHRVFQNHRSSEWLLAKLASLERSGKIQQVTKQGDRKGSVTAWALKGSYAHAGTSARGECLRGRSLA